MNNLNVRLTIDFDLRRQHYFSNCQNQNQLLLNMTFWDSLGFDRTYGRTRKTLRIGIGKFIANWCRKIYFVYDQVIIYMVSRYKKRALCYNCRCGLRNFQYCTSVYTRSFYHQSIMSKYNNQDIENSFRYIT